MAGLKRHDKAILMCAFGGDLVDRVQVQVPRSLVELGTAARRVVDAGASAIHVDFDVTRTQPRRHSNRDPQTALHIVRTLRAASPEVIISLSLGPSLSTDDTTLEILRQAEPEYVHCSLAVVSRSPEPSDETALFTNFEAPQQTIESLAEAGIRLEVECSDRGMLSALPRLQQSGIFEELARRQGIFGLVLSDLEHGPSEPDRLDFMVDQVPDDILWRLRVRGRSTVWPMQQRAIALHGLLRTGLDDTLFRLDGTRARNNADLVADLADCVRAAGREPASPAEARAILGLAH